MQDEIGPDAVVAFWQEAGPERWFNKDAEFDATLRARFGALHAEAAAGRKAEWTKTPLGALALILVLDQFSRNMFRGMPEAFAQDAMARDVARRALDAGFDKDVPAELRMFFHLPFMHAETIAEQERCVRDFHSLGGYEGLSYARLHRDAIRRFGRFPHRNAALGRHTSPAERAYLEGGGFAG
jgi:uncharacterized protein (DUF924 family)